MKRLFALSASALAIAGSLAASAPASAQESESAHDFQMKYGGSIFGGSRPLQETNTAKAPGPMSRKKLPAIRAKAASFMADHGCKADDPVYFRAFKKEGEVDVWAQCDGRGTAYKKIATWDFTSTNGVNQILGYKNHEGDSVIPEGLRRVNGVKPSTNYYLAIDLGYPDAADRARPITTKVQNKKGQWVMPGRGGLTLFHGPYGSIGCIPLKIAHIEIAYALVEAATEAGAPVYADVFPTRDMSDSNLRFLAGQKGAYAKYLPFWRNLAAMDQHFQKTKIRAAIVPHGTMYALAADQAAPAVVAKTQDGVKIAAAPQQLSPEDDPDVWPKPSTFKDIPGQTAQLTQPSLDPEFGLAASACVSGGALFLSPATLVRTQICAENTSTLFVNAATGETRVFKPGRGDSYIGYVPASDTGRVLNAAGMATLTNH